jgi:peptidyl-tRNA hydrolase
VIVLCARDEESLCALHAVAVEAGIPCALFEDERDDGSPTFTCLGLGPLPHDEARCVTGSLPLMK